MFSYAGIFPIVARHKGILPPNPMYVTIEFNLELKLDNNLYRAVVNYFIYIGYTTCYTI